MCPIFFRNAMSSLVVCIQFMALPMWLGLGAQYLSSLVYSINTVRAYVLTFGARDCKFESCLVPMLLLFSFFKWMYLKFLWTRNSLLIGTHTKLGELNLVAIVLCGLIWVLCPFWFAVLSPCMMIGMAVLGPHWLANICKVCLRPCRLHSQTSLVLFYIGINHLLSFIFF